MFGIIKKEENKKTEELLNCLPAEKKYCPATGYSVSDTIENIADAAGQIAVASRNYSKILKMSSQCSLIKSCEKMQDTLNNTTLGEDKLREILGDDYYSYRR